MKLFLPSFAPNSRNTAQRQRCIGFGVGRQRMSHVAFHKARRNLLRVLCMGRINASGCSGSCWLSNDITRKIRFQQSRIAQNLVAAKNRYISESSALPDFHRQLPIKLERPDPITDHMMKDGKTLAPRHMSMPHIQLLRPGLEGSSKFSLRLISLKNRD